MAASSPAAAGPVQLGIEKRLAELCGDGDDVHVEVINESYMHNVPRGSESHFKVVCVSGVFDGVKLIERHRMVNAALDGEFGAGLHALSIVAKTPAQWTASGGSIPQSPNCLGGSKK